MGGLSIWHWLVVLLIIVLIFGTKRLRNIGSDLGAAMRDFKKGLNDNDEQSPRTLKADEPDARKGAADEARANDQAEERRAGQHEAPGGTEARPETRERPRPDVK